MREYPSSARQYKLPPQALWRWHPTLIYHHQDPQHKPASLSRAATSSTSPSAHSLRSWLPTSPPPRQSWQRGQAQCEAWEKLVLTFLFPCCCLCTKGHVWAHKPMGLNLVLGPVSHPALWQQAPSSVGLSAAMGEEQGGVWVGRGRKLALGEQHNAEVAVGIGVPISSPHSLLPSPPAPHLTLPFPSLSHSASHPLSALGKRPPKK